MKTNDYQEVADRRSDSQRLFVLGLILMGAGLVCLIGAYVAHNDLYLKIVESLSK